MVLQPPTRDAAASATACNTRGCKPLVYGAAACNTVCEHRVLQVSFSSLVLNMEGDGLEVDSRTMYTIHSLGGRAAARTAAHATDVTDATHATAATHATHATDATHATAATRGTDTTHATDTTDLLTPLPQRTTLAATHRPCHTHHLCRCAPPLLRRPRQRGAARPLVRRRRGAARAHDGLVPLLAEHPHEGEPASTRACCVLST